jgi:5-methylcytosine-specific restriction endonuclease McrA
MADQETTARVAARKAYYRRWYAANRDKQLSYMREWNVANRENQLAKKRAHYQANKDKWPTYAERGPEVVKARVAAWQKANPDKVAARNARWKKAHPEAVKADYARRSPSKRGKTDGHYTRADTNAILIRQDHKCANPYCRADLLVVKKHIDHIIALKHGGTNWPSNLQWLCAPCNLDKRDKDHDEWLASYVAKRSAA